ncbi:serine dehydratase subunit alpha family protein [Xylanibacter brevis]|uniref:L-cysteine desulfidase family protein n=1 Tax=Xylanibacter brevis TaxID=83231 RepID=UPI0004800CCA|nr:L-serine ammonia-lyase, iron-sulfur-dependent, subunit alpha [Xylanibacter brevis]
MNTLTKLILDDMRPALGVTEPGAIAFAVASAKGYVKGNLRSIRLTLNSGMYKNAFTCGIPNSNEVGIAHAAALGYVAAVADKKLECLDGVKPIHNRQARKIVSEGRIQVTMGDVSSRIYIHAVVTTDKGDASVTIEDTHINITEIVQNGKVVLKAAKKKNNGKRAAADTPLIHRYTLRQLLNYVNRVPIDEITFIRHAYDLNLALFQEALQSSKATITDYLYSQNHRQVISADEQKTASLLCNGAIEARVLGLSKPAMSITGSGAHGIIATLPLYASCRVNDYGEEQLLRATALSYLVCMYIKEYSGKLSAFCGCAIAAGTGMACGLAYLKGGTHKTLTLVIQNMASSITGMICDGGNHGCAMKGIVAVDAAYQSVNLALCGIAIERQHGINGPSAEQTMRHIGLIASPGMVQTEGVIVDVMRQK